MIEKLAGSFVWMILFSRAFTAITPTELKFCRQDRNQEAWDWIQG
jgi:hypothetical protein